MNTAYLKTKQAQQLAANPLHSSWVSANAGSGKTRVLINRVIRMLLDGTPPERILCLTFTKAAASEMTNRLYETLGEWTTLSDEKLIKEIHELSGQGADREILQKARCLFARAIETPGGLKIQTIHAFCEKVLGRFPVEADVVPHFDVLDDQSANEMLAEVRNSFFRDLNAGVDPALNAAWRIVIRDASDKTIDELLAEIQSRRIWLGQLFETVGLDGAIDRLRSTLVSSGTWDHADATRSFIEAIPTADLRHAIGALASGSSKDQQRASELGQFIAREDAAEGLAAYKSIFLTQKNEPRKTLATKAVLKAHPGVEQTLVDEQARVKDFDEELKTILLFERSSAVMRVAVSIVARYERAKRLRGVLDYDDLILKTVNLLKRYEAGWVLYKLDGGIDHILVDEAQDTSPLQWEVVKRLSEEFFAGSGASDTKRTVFAVGDEKQSIYSFQGADPAEFVRMRSFFETCAKAIGAGWENVPLDLSFRSVPDVLEFIDQVFGSFPPGVLSSAAELHHSAYRENEVGLVEVWEPICPDEEEARDPWDAPLDQLSQVSPRAKLAQRIADTIQGWLREPDFSVGREGNPLEAGDIMILVRRRNAFVEEMIRQLKMRDIPVAGIDRMVLTDQIAVMDLIAVGQFALLPEDDLTLAAILRSPLIGMSEEDLYALANGRDGTLWQALNDAQAIKDIYGEASRFLRQVLSMADLVRPFEFYARILVGLGGRELLIGRLGEDARDPIDEFVRMTLDFERTRAPSLQGFLKWIEKSQSDIKRDLGHGRNEVRVMTIHGAKGLEAGVVFLPDTCSVPTGQNDPKLVQIGGTNGSVVWRARSEFDTEQSKEACDADREKRHAEYFRLLYVALTRATDRLYICGYEGKNGRPKDCWYDLIENTISSLTDPISDRSGERVWRLERNAPRVKSGRQEAADAPADIMDVPPWVQIRATIESEGLVTQPSKLGAGDGEPPVLSPITLSASDRFLRGRLIHKLLELLPSVEPSRRALMIEKFLSRRSQQMSSEQRDEVSERVLSILNDTDMARLFGLDSQGEVPVIGHLQGPKEKFIVNGQVDRMVVENERVLLADYKTNRPAPTELENVSPAYVRQMALYRALLTNMFPDRSIDCVLIWTDGPKIMKIPPLMMDEALQQILQV